MNRARTTFRTVQLFAVSALGHQPRGDKLGSRGIAPQRCLDPLKWALSRAGDVPVPAALTPALKAGSHRPNEGSLLLVACAGIRWPPTRDDGSVVERNVLGSDLEPCGTDPMTGFFRDGCCGTGPEDLGSHTICAVVTAEFLHHQRIIGNDLSTPRPQYRFRGLVPGDRWCVTAVNWARAHADGVAAPVVLASTNEAVLEIVPLAALQELAVDVPDDPGAL